MLEQNRCERERRRPNPSRDHSPQWEESEPCGREGNLAMAPSRHKLAPQEGFVSIAETDVYDPLRFRKMTVLEAFHFLP